MNDLILKALQERASPIELRELRRWRDRSPDNERRYQEVARLWALTADADAAGGEHREPDPWEVVRRATIRGDRSRLAHRAAPVQHATARASRHARRRLRRGVAVAAAVVIGAVGFWQWESRLDPQILTGSEVRTEDGETTTVHLADGSFVRLAPSSRLRFDAAGDGRQVRLDGRAFFAVAHAARPFTVHTVRGEAVVLGTRFDLDTSDDNLTLVVVDGRVALSSDGQRVEVAGGEMTRTSRGAALEAHKVDDVYGYLEWMGRTLLFQGTSLTDVAREIERVYGAEVVIDDASLGSRTLTASFTNQSFDDVMGAVCEVLSLECEIHPDRARIDGGAPTISTHIAPQERR